MSIYSILPLINARHPLKLPTKIPSKTRKNTKPHNSWGNQRLCAPLRMWQTSWEVRLAALPLPPPQEAGWPPTQDPQPVLTGNPCGPLGRGDCFLRQLC